MPSYTADDLDNLGNNFFTRQVAPYYMQGRYYFSGEKCFGKRIEDYVWPITPKELLYDDHPYMFYSALKMLPKFKVHKVNTTDFYRYYIDHLSNNITLDEIKILLLAAGFDAVKVRIADWKINTTYSAFHARFPSSGLW